MTKVAQSDSAAPDAVVNLVGISKTYVNGVSALRGVDLVLNKGQIHAVVGENGAGKSTLVKILFGLEEASSGEIFVNGKLCTNHNSISAISAGIGMVHQHFKLVKSLSVAENVVLGIEPLHWGFFDRQTAVRKVAEIAELAHIKINSVEIVGNLTVGDLQKVEILKALYRRATVLILDEPTAVLTPQESRRLLESVSELAASGQSICFISHKIKEVMDCADSISVLRSGRRVALMERHEASIDGIAKAMIGREIGLNRPQQLRRDKGSQRLVIKNLSSAAIGLKRLNDVTLAVCGGEIVGVAGVEGNGQDDLIDQVTGLSSARVGSVWFDGLDASNLGPRERRRLGLRHIASDRTVRGTAKNLSISENFISNSIREVSNRWGVLKEKVLRERSTVAIADFEINTDSVDSKMWTLSGGNAQKVVIARELSGICKVIVASNPTRGVDVGTIELIHQKLIEKKNSDVAILLISSDLDELVLLSDRIVVLARGSIVAEFKDPSNLDIAELGAAMGDAIV